MSSRNSINLRVGGTLDLIGDFYFVSATNTIVDIDNTDTNGYVFNVGKYSGLGEKVTDYKSLFGYIIRIFDINNGTYINSVEGYTSNTDFIIIMKIGQATIKVQWTKIQRYIPL